MTSSLEQCHVVQVCIDLKYIASIPYRILLVLFVGFRIKNLNYLGYEGRLLYYRGHLL